ncbi:MAG: TetR/AcrR family transcriptional regulator [Spirochaetes bacterium]|nr:MAG: TetR/AcrR family transcriptional regulator [Spirochaetota bacterium]
MKKKEDITRIYRAALAAFAEYGFKKATVDDIAGRLGMTKGNLYLYAKDKRGLYDHAVAHALREWQGRVLRAVRAQNDPRAQFRVMALKAMEYLGQDDDLRRILARDPGIFPMFTDNDPYGEINRNSVAIITGILKAGIRTGVFRKLNIAALPQILFMIYKMFIIGSYISPEGGLRQKMFGETIELITRGIFREDAAEPVRGGSPVKKGRRAKQ